MHVDPAAGWFPHYAGYAGERGTGDGTGANRNLPLAPGTGDQGWLAAVDLLCAEAAAYGADALVVSLGLPTLGQLAVAALTGAAEAHR